MAIHPDEQRIETDVLVVGGGLAGCFAAMKAAEDGVRVTLVEKAHVAHCGSNTTGIDHYPYCYIPEVHGKLGYTIEDFVKNHTIVGSGLVDQELCKMMWQDSYDRLLDLEKIGIKIRFEKIYPWNFGFEPGEYRQKPKFRIVPWPGFKVPCVVSIEGRYIKAMLYKRLSQLGVHLLHFCDVQELVKQNGSVVGALGLTTRTGEFLVLEAKATVLATGFLSRLFPQTAMFNHLVPPNETGEGQTMAFHAGAELAVMEQYPRYGQRVILGAARLENWIRSSPATPSGYPAGRIVNSAGEVMPSNNRDFDQSFNDELYRKQADWVRTSIRQGKTPFYWDATLATEEERAYANWSSAEEGGGVELYRHLEEDLKADLATHQIQLAKPRVYEPGQSMGFILTSPGGILINTRCETSVPGLFAAGENAYGEHFPSSPWAIVTGSRAGRSAGAYARGATVMIRGDLIKEGRERILRPFAVKDGLTWQELNRGINNLIENYFIGASVNARRIGLEQVEALKREQVQAANPHEWMRAMETLSLLTVAEIFLRASLFPRKPDEWRILKKVDGEMKFMTRPIQQKYPVSLPEVSREQKIAKG